MGFQLRIAEGKEAGREFVFEQQTVAIGRSSDCDVVLYDPGVSRRHARIFEEGEGFFVEDLGSANGTKINGELIQKQALNDGDTITLGPVVFEFVGTEMALPDPAEAVADQSTRIVQLDQIKRQKNRGEALAPQGAGSEELDQLRQRATRTMQAVSRPRPTGTARALASGGAGRPARAGSRAPLARAEDGTDPAAIQPAGPEREEGRKVLTAAERARIKREAGSGAMANLRIFWIEASQSTRRIAWASAAAIVLGIVALLYWLVLSPGADGQQNLAQEPGVLTSEPLEASFGWGEGVDFPRQDMKVFDFEFISPARGLVILHYQAKDISAGEVTVICNGVEVGQVPPDTLASSDRVLELVIPPSVLKKGEVNQLIFDNTRNPPGEDAWRVWNARIEPVMLPELDVAQLQLEAKASFDRGLRSMERKEVGAENRYNAWKDFRNAWLLLEGHPDPKPALYDLARAKVKEAQQELDVTCAKLMLEAETYYNQKNWDGARATLDHVKAFFPNDRDQLCRARAEQKRYLFGL